MLSASLSLSLPRLGWKSTSTPRSLKICTAAGESASEMRTFGGMIDDLSGRYAVLVMQYSFLSCAGSTCAAVLRKACGVRPGNDGNRYAALRNASLLLANAQS